MALFMNLHHIYLWILFSGNSAINCAIRFSQNSQIENVIGKLAYEIASSHFPNLHCSVLISGNGNDVFKYFRKDTSVFTINLQVSSSLNDGTSLRIKNSYSVRKAILQALNDGCLLFLINCNATEQIIRDVSYISQLAVARSTRKFVILPALVNDALYRNPNYESIFAMKEMDFLPDLIACVIDLEGKCTLTVDDNKKCNNCQSEGINSECDGDDFIFTDVNDLLLEAEKVTNYSLFESSVGFEPGTEPCVKLVTHAFVGRQPDKEVILDIWIPKTGFVWYSNLFPDKVKSLQNKVLRLASFDYPPYSVVKPPLFDGTEFRLLSEFCRRHGAKWRLVTDDNLWGTVWDNGSGVGLSGLVATDSADLGFGSMYIWHHEFQWLDFSAPYYRTAVTCLMPKPLPLPAAVVLLLPFSPKLWLAVFFSLLGASIALVVVARASIVVRPQVKGPTARGYRTLMECFLCALGMVTQQPPVANLIRGPIRHLIAWFSFVFLMIGTCYSGGLASVLTIPLFESPVDTLEQLAASNILWAANHEAWIFSIRDANETSMVRVKDNFRVLPDDKLATLATSGRIGFGVERLAGGNFALGEYLNEISISSLRIMSQDLYWDQVALIARKGSPYVPAVNSLIHRLIQSGIPLHWEDQVVRQFLSPRIQIAVKQSGATVSSSVPTALKISHVKGALTILVSGLILSSVVFCGELMAAKYATAMPQK